MLEIILRKATLKDVLIVLIASFAIVGFWRGTWNLFDKFVFPTNFLLSQITTIIGGVIILMILSRYK